MAKKRNNVVPFDRNRAAGPWQPLERMQISAEGQAEGVQAAFVNNRYAVYVKQTTGSGFFTQGPDGRPQPAPVIHLIVVRRDGKAPAWKDLQRIKNEILHEEAEGVEIFPSESRRVDEPQTHLWFLPPGMRIPMGLMPAVAEPSPDDEVIPGVIRRGDLQFFVIETPQEEGESPIVEVFADEEDASASYAAAEHPMPDGGALRLLGDVPMEEEGAAWSPGAQARREALQDRIAQAGAENAALQQEMEDRVRWPDHPPGLEEELEEEGMWGGPLDEGPPDLIEQDRMATAMEEGIARKRAERAAAVEQAEATAEDANAKADLARMREQLVRSGSIDPTDGGNTTLN